MKKRVVLAYSGGLDTSVAVAYLSHEFDMEVIAVAVDVGQNDDFESMRQRAIDSGAVEAVVVDYKNEYSDKYLTRALKSNALYENRYPLVSSLSRPAIVKVLVEQAEKFNATGIAHGCTGKGNDQVRFEVSIRALAPHFEIYAPTRDWNMTREESIDYAQSKGVTVPITKDKLYSIDENIWGRAIECGILEDPWNRPPDDIWSMTRVTQNEPTETVISFESGVPVALDDKKMSFLQIISELNSLVGSYGFGRIDMVENRRVGIKSRETYEAPGALALIQAHRDLEGVTLERNLAHEKITIEPKIAELIYDGLWFSPLMEAYGQFIDSSQKYVTGDVRIQLAPYSCSINGRKSPYSLYDYNLATYDATDSFNHSDAEGFVKLWGLGISTWAQKQKGV